jgi:hypothetical protein
MAIEMPETVSPSPPALGVAAIAGALHVVCGRRDCATRCDHQAEAHTLAALVVSHYLREQGRRS